MSRKTEAAVAIIAVHGGGLDVERSLRVLSDRGCTLQPSPEGGSDCGLLHVGCDRGCMSGRTEATVGSPPSTGEALIVLRFIACRNIDRGCTTQPSPGGGFVCGLKHVRQGQRRTFPAIFPREDGVGLRGKVRWAVFSSRNCWELATDVQPKLRRNASLATRPITPTSGDLLLTVPTYTS